MLRSGGANFNETDIATLESGDGAHDRFAIDFAPGAGNDVVRIYIDGALEDHRNDVGELLPLRPGAGRRRQRRADDEQRSMFREGGTAGTAGNAGNGFLIDGVSLSLFDAGALHHDLLRQPDRG